MPPLTASWADSQRARHPIGPWSLVADSNCRPAHYECAALPAELTKHGRMFYTGYHPAIRAANPFLPAPFGSHADGFCIVPSPPFSGLIRDWHRDSRILSGTAPVCLFFYRLSIGIRTADHKWTMLAKFNVVAYGDGDDGAGSGNRTRIFALEGRSISRYTIPA